MDKPSFDIKDALLEGAWALNYCRELLANRTSKPEPDDVAERREAMRLSAEMLTEMASSIVGERA